MGTEYTLAIVTGLLGGFGHCIGMCGPVVAALSLHGRGSFTLAAHLLYNAGRVFTYTFIGALMGLGGSFVDTASRLAGLQSLVSVLAGGMMLLLGLSVAGLLPFRPRLESGGGLFLKAARAVLESGSPLRFFPLGLLFGFLPCGLSYSIFLGSAAKGDMLGGFLFALAFGLATVPALLCFGVVVNFLGARVRGILYRAGGVAVAVTGAVFIARGAGLHGAL